MIWYEMNETLFSSIFGLFAILITQVEVLVLNVEEHARVDVLSV